ncbi:MAG: hypothetical protein PF569_04755 [Candidatus Woesearchaeota archaeon]|jgi:hypothetical protein|nr:hypothetical protein [Candidatus Woesearchaeota archaeon]
MNSDILDHERKCPLKEEFKKCDIQKTKDISELRTDIAVFNNSFRSMEEKFDKLEASQDKRFNKLELIMTTWIDAADNKYATKKTTDFQTKVLRFLIT